MADRVDRVAKYELFKVLSPGQRSPAISGSCGGATLSHRSRPAGFSCASRRRTGSWAGASPTSRGTLGHRSRLSGVSCASRRRTGSWAGASPRFSDTVAAGVKEMMESVIGGPSGCTAPLFASGRLSEPFPARLPSHDRGSISHPVHLAEASPSKVLRAVRRSNFDECSCWNRPGTALKTTVLHCTLSYHAGNRDNGRLAYPRLHRRSGTLPARRSACRCIACSAARCGRGSGCTDGAAATTTRPTR